MPDRPEPGSETGAATPTRRVTGLRDWTGGFEHAPRRPAAIAPQTINPTKRAARSETRSWWAGNRLCCEAPADKAVRVSYCFSAGGPSTPGLFALVFAGAGHIDNPRTHRGGHCLRRSLHNLNLHDCHSVKRMVEGGRAYRSFSTTTSTSQGRTVSFFFSVFLLLAMGCLLLVDCVPVPNVWMPPRARAKRHLLRS